MKIKDLTSEDQERIALFATELGEKFSKELLAYYLILIKTTALQANKK
jgi:hypothetical protein